MDKKIFKLVSTSPMRTVESPFCLCGERMATFCLEEAALREVKGKIESDIPVWKSVTVGRVIGELNAFAQACLCSCR